MTFPFPRLRRRYHHAIRGAIGTTTAEAGEAEKAAKAEKGAQTACYRRQRLVSARRKSVINCQEAFLDFSPFFSSFPPLFSSSASPADPGIQISTQISTQNSTQLPFLAGAPLATSYSSCYPRHIRPSLHSYSRHSDSGYSGSIIPITKYPLYSNPLATTHSTSMFTTYLTPSQCLKITPRTNLKVKVFLHQPGL